MFLTINILPQYRRYYVRLLSSQFCRRLFLVWLAIVFIFKWSESCLFFEEFFSFRTPIRFFWKFQISWKTALVDFYTLELSKYPTNNSEISLKTFLKETFLKISENLFEIIVNPACWKWVFFYWYPLLAQFMIVKICSHKSCFLA